MLHFSQRLALGDAYEQWVEENRVVNCPMSMVTFLQSNGLLNEAKASAFINVYNAEKLSKRN